MHGVLRIYLPGARHSRENAATDPDGNVLLRRQRPICGQHGAGEVEGASDQDARGAWPSGAAGKASAGLTLSQAAA
jgi:hypothetical protein